MNEIDDVAPIDVDKRLAAFIHISQFIQKLFPRQRIIFAFFRVQGVYRCQLIHGERSSCDGHPTKHEYRDFLAVCVDRVKDSIVYFVEVRGQFFQFSRDLRAELDFLEVV